MGDIITQGNINATLEDIKSCESLDQLMTWIGQLKAVKQALEAAHKFREMSVRYAQSHAAALIRVIELGGEKELRGKERKVAVWLSELSPAGREKYIAMCEEGMTIDMVYYREVESKQKIADALQKAKNLREDVIQTVKEEGIVDISGYIDSLASSPLEPSVRSDLIDGTRNRLRKAGAIGVGNNSYVYVMRGSGRTEEIKKAIKTRYESIIADFESIEEIQKASGVTVDISDLDIVFADKMGRNKRFYSYVILALCQIGALNEDTAMEQMAKDDFYREVQYARDKLRMNREQYISMQYQAIQGGRA